MSNAKIQFRLPEDLKDAAMRQAAESGISMNLYDTGPREGAVAASGHTGRGAGGRQARCDRRAGIGRAPPVTRA